MIAKKTIARRHIFDNLRGQIVQISQSTVRKDEDRLATEFDVSISAQVEWVRKDGGQIAPKSLLSETMNVSVERGENFADALQLALGALARSIVYTLEDPGLLKESREAGH